MMRLLKYELKRLMLGKVYLGLFVIVGLFAWQTLTGSVIRGVGYTAPFSPWSYGYYLASMMPLLSVTLLFFLSYLYTPAEARVCQITRATRTDVRTQIALRYVAMIIGYAVLVLLVMLLASIFYARFFRHSGFEGFLVPLVLTILPCLLFTFGIGALAGRVHPALLYALMLMCVLMTQIALPGFIDFTGAAYYSATPLTLPVGIDGEPAFIVQSGFVIARVMMAVIGLVMMCASFFPRKGRVA